MSLLPLNTTTVDFSWNLAEIKSQVVISKVEVAERLIPHIAEDEGGDFIWAFTELCKRCYPKYYTIYVTLDNGDRYMALIWGETLEVAEHAISSFLKRGEGLELVPSPPDGQERGLYRNFPRLLFKDPATGETSTVFVNIS
ncbi:MAG TPA: hypothetical protein VLG44_02735 [Chlamydiales bacterium]|nr:hypothetical protein [Chlamydiales bacterium]